MFGKSVIAMAAAAGIAVADTLMVYNGTTFSVGPSPSGKNYEDSVQSTWQIQAAQNANHMWREILSGRVSKDARACASHTISSKNDLNNVESNLLLKQCLLQTNGGDDGMIRILQSETNKADDFWHQIVSQSNPDKNTYSPASAKVKIFINGLSDMLFAGWTLSPAADPANLAANPEHYIKKSTAGSVSSEILEGWAGYRTHFHVPEYAMPDTATYPWDLNATVFPIPLQRVGQKVLMDGQTEIGTLHIAVRNLTQAEYYNGVGGIEVWSEVWYGDALPMEFKEDESIHMVNEIFNLAIMASKNLGILPHN